MERMLKREDVCVLLEKADEQTKAIIRFAVQTGMKREQIVMVRWKDIDGGGARTPLSEF